MADNKLQVEEFDEGNYEMWKRSRYDCIRYLYGHGSSRVLREILSKQVKAYINLVTLLRSLGSLNPSSDENSFTYYQKLQVLCFLRDLVRNLRSTFYTMLEACKVCING